jgi:C4-type Zn-finger protein
MALNKTQLKASIKAMLNDLKDDVDQTAAIEKYAEMISTAIDEYVKTATVIGTDSMGGPITGTIQ